MHLFICILLLTFVNESITTMNRRLQQFLEAENITQSLLADTLGVTRASISHILSGRNRPGFDFLESIALHYPEISLEWLLTGRGKMYREASKTATEDPQTAISVPPRKVQRIVVFYDDATFEEFSQ